MLTSLGNQFQLEGFIRTARYKDAINVGQISPIEIAKGNTDRESVATEKGNMIQEEQSPREAKKHKRANATEINKQTSV